MRLLLAGEERLERRLFGGIVGIVTAGSLAFPVGTCVVRRRLHVRSICPRGGVVGLGESDMRLMMSVKSYRYLSGHGPMP